MSRPVVDLVIAVHSAERPIQRAAASVLDATDAAIRVTVVCHDLDAARIEAQLGTHSADPRLRLVELRDGVRSPSGPFNRGLELADADFTGIMGSDDELEPGAVDSWLRRQRDDRAHVVIPRLRFASGRIVSSPPVRPFRSRRLDGVRDRLSYRSAPLGIFSRERFGRLRLESGMRNGGDLAFVAQLWFADASVSFDRSGPAYVIHDDATDRVTFAPKPVSTELEWLPRLTGRAELAALPEQARVALARKLARVHVFGAIYNRRDAPGWLAREPMVLEASLASLRVFAPGFERSLSRADHRLIAAIAAGVEEHELVRLASVRRRPDSWSTLTAPTFAGTIDRDGPFRLALAAFIVGRSTRARQERV